MPLYVVVGCAADAVTVAPIPKYSLVLPSNVPNETFIGSLVPELNVTGVPLRAALPLTTYVQAVIGRLLPDGGFSCDGIDSVMVTAEPPCPMRSKCPLVAALGAIVFDVEASSLPKSSECEMTRESGQATVAVIASEPDPLDWATTGVATAAATINCAARHIRRITTGMVTLLPRARRVRLVVRAEYMVDVLWRSERGSDGGSVSLRWVCMPWQVRYGVSVTVFTPNDGDVTSDSVVCALRGVGDGIVSRYNPVGTSLGNR